MSKDTPVTTEGFMREYNEFLNTAENTYRPGDVEGMIKHAIRYKNNS